MISLISYYLMQGLPIPIDAADFQVSLKTKFLERDGMMFLPDQAAEYEEQKRKLGMTKQIDFIFDVIYSESDALAWLKDRLARNHRNTKTSSRNSSRPMPLLEKAKKR